MRINGQNYKSLITLLKKKLETQTKTQTYRLTFIPTFEIGEIVALTFKKEFLYFVKILKVYPKQIKDLTLVEAQLDGFNTVKEFQDKVMNLNSIKSKNRWGFIIVFKKWNGQKKLKLS